MPQFGASSLLALGTCDERLQIMAHEVILYIDHKILQGHRGEVEQHKAFLDGTSKLDWPNGNHNKFPSMAMDVAPGYMEGGKWQINWKDLAAFGRLMGHYERVALERGYHVRFGIDWDMDWRSSGFDPDSTFLDAPHIEILGGL